MIHRFLLRALSLLALAVLAVSLPACTSRFERRWSAPSAQAASHDAFSGRWEGAWRSAKHRGAGGRLRCVFTRIAAGRYEAYFKANWLLFSSSYEAVFQTEQRSGMLRFRGRHDLPVLFGGTYSYVGEVTAAHFSAKYDSSHDRGTFAMTRPAR